MADHDMHLPHIHTGSTVADGHHNMTITGHGMSTTDGLSCDIRGAVQACNNHTLAPAMGGAVAGGVLGSVIGGPGIVGGAAAGVVGGGIGGCVEGVVYHWQGCF